MDKFSWIMEYYSSLPNKRTGPNKCTGWNFDKNQISVQGEILIKVLEYKGDTVLQKVKSQLGKCDFPIP